MAAESPTDGELALRARGGDRAAFEALHRRFCACVHGLLLAHRPPHDAEDLLQEVFLAAWRRLETLREVERFGPWLLAIARNVALGARRRARAPEPLEERAQQVASRPDRLSAEGAEILRLMRELPEAYRETLSMRLVGGLSGPEIAAATGLTHGSVRVNLHRGMQLLRERLRQEGWA